MNNTHKLFWLLGLLWVGTVCAQPISDPAFEDLNTINITDRTKIRFLVANIQDAVPGTSQDIGLDQIQSSVQSVIITATGHGHTSDDNNKPLSGVEEYDDTDETMYPGWILAQVIDANTIRIVPPGGVLTIPNTMIESGSITAGTNLYWDSTVGDYVFEKPADGANNAPRVLVVAANDGTNSTVVFSPSIDAVPLAYECEIVGQNSATPDTAAFTAATAKLEANGGGTILLNGTVRLNANFNFTTPVSIIGVKGTNPKIIAVDTAGKLSWNSGYSPSASGVLIPNTAAKASMVAVPRGTLTRGDWFYIQSDDDIEGVQHTTASITAGQNCTFAVSATITSASAHGYSVNQPVVFQTVSGTPPANLTLNETYWVATTPTSTTFTVSQDFGGTAQAMSDAGSGTIVCRPITANAPGEIHQCKEVRGTAPARVITSVDTSAETLTCAAHGYSNGNRVIFTATAVPGGMSKSVIYYVVGVTTDTFQVSLTSGGAAVNITGSPTGTLYSQIFDGGSRSLTVTADSGTDVFTYTNHGFLNNQAIEFTSVGGLGSILTDRHYHIINVTSNTFQISTTSGGSAVNFTGSGGTITVDGYDYVVFDDIVVDALTVNPRLVVMDPIDGIEISGFTVDWEGTTPPATDVHWDIRHAVNIKIQDIRWAHDGPASIMLSYVGNVLVSDCIGEHNKSSINDKGYFIIVQASNRVRIQDSVFTGFRHVVTTAGQTHNNARRGTPRNLVVDNITVSMNGRWDSSLVPFDTHAEGWGILFQNCHVQLTYDPQFPTASLTSSNINYAFQSRSRGTIFKGCVIEGAGITSGINLYSSDNRVEDCTFCDCWRGVHIIDGSPIGSTAGLSTGVHRNVVVHCTFDDLIGPAIYGTVGNGHRFAHNECYNCGQTASSGMTKSIVLLTGGTGYWIAHNTLDRVTNDFSIGGATQAASAYTKVVGNTMTGYTAVGSATDSGFESANPDAAALQALGDAYNITD